MDKCEVCGNTYENLFEVKFKKDGASHWFDSLECAAHKLAPKCSRCGVRILGHGVQASEEIFCGAHCARLRGHTNIVDHTEQRAI